MEKHQAMSQSLLSSANGSDLASKQAYLDDTPPIDGTSILQTFFYTWLHPFLKYNSKFGVSIDALPSLPKTHHTSSEYAAVMQIWSSLPPGSSEGRKLIKSLLLAYKKQLRDIFLISLVVVLSFIALPLMTSYNIDYISNHRQDLQYGIALFLITLTAQTLNNLFFSQLMHRYNFIGAKMSNALNIMIYQKSLKYSVLASRRFSQAEIINYSQTDAERMNHVGFQLSSLFYGPIQIVFALIMMCLYVGISVLAGVSIVACLMIFNYFISKKISRLNEEVLGAKDERMKVTQEMLDAIRFIKISAIEKLFFNKLEDKRGSEIAFSLKKGFAVIFMVFMYWITAPLLLSATFITYTALGNQLSPQIAFTIIILGHIVDDPIRSLPSAISELIQILASLKRIQTFLLTEEIQPNLIVHEVDSQDAIRIQNGNFYWGKQQKSQEDPEKEEMHNQQKVERDFKSNQQLQSDQTNENGATEQIYVLKDINLTIQKGKFVMIVGDIGSGKSSLLEAVLNEMLHHSQSRIFLSGSMAYSPQKPWIMSKTVRDNVTFNLPFDQIKFNQVIYYSSLEHDLKMLPQGSETEIGEKGITISGGQKARLSLARALYSGNDIYLLDDILSAVDVHVGDFLMRETLKGFLKGKTILLPTHALRYIEHADEIIIMRKGRIVKKGHYDEIRNSAEFQELSEKEAKHEKQVYKKDKQETCIEAEIGMVRQAFKHKSQGQAGNHETANINDVLIQQLILPEDQEIGHVSLKIFNEFIQNCGGFSKFIIPVLISMLLWISCETLASIFIYKLCEDPSKNSIYLYLLALFILLSCVFVLIRSIIMTIASAKQGKVVHTKMIKSLLYASLSNFFNRVPTGRIVNRLTHDLSQIDEDITDSIAQIGVSILELLSTLLICIYASSYLSIIPMVAVGIICYQMRAYYLRTQRELARFQKSTNSPVVSGFMSTINGLSSIRAYKQEDIFMQMQMANTDQHKRVRLSKSGLQNWFFNIISVLSFLVSMPCIAYCMFNENSNPSLMGLLMVYALILCQDIQNITFSSAHFETKLVSLERIYKFMNIEPETDYQQYCKEWSPQEEGGKQVFEQGSLEFNSLYASYRQDLPNVLNGITCTILPGEKVGIVGRTGAGKSTIINTLLRITNITAGSIAIDGVDLQKYPLKDLRYSITMIDQQPTLIKSTFRENLDITGEYSDIELEGFLKECNLFDIISEKGGLGAMVSNSSLSAGEKQLLCICRAFLKRSRIVLIDQATANIDVKNDARIQRIIADKFKDSTVLTIAHRLSTLKNSGKIMVLQKGALVEFGDPNELEQRKGGFYAEMIQKNAAQLLL